MRMVMVTLVKMAMMQVQVLWREENLEKPLCEAQIMAVSAKYRSPEKMHIFSQVVALNMSHLGGVHTPNLKKHL